MRVMAVFAAGLFCSSARSQTAEEYEVLDAANAARENGDVALALRYLDALVQHSPELPNAYYNRAITRRAANDNAGARQDLDRTIQLNPKWSGAYGIRAHLRMDAHDYAGAIEDAIAYGNSSEQVELRGYARIALGRHAEALEDFTFLRSGRFGPYTNARYPFALCLLALGRTADAVEWFKTDYADGGNVEARYSLNLGYSLLGRYEEAERDLAEWVAEHAANPAEIPEYDRAQRENLRDNIDSAYYLLSAVRFAQQDFAGSVAALEKIPASSPLNDDAQLLRHLTLLRTKQSAPDPALVNFSSDWPA
jgi:tetratricopeptide (TPR) repeat protein